MTNEKILEAGRHPPEVGTAGFILLCGMFAPGAVLAYKQSRIEIKILLCNFICLINLPDREA